MGGSKMRGPRGRDVAGEGGAAAELAVEELRQAIRLNKGDAEAYRLLGRALYVLPKITSDHIAELSKGVFLGEEGQIIRIYRSALHTRLNQTDEAMEDLRHVIADVDVSPQNRENAVQRLAGLHFDRDLKIVEGHAREKNYAAARDILKTATSTPECEVVAASYASLSEWVDENEAWSVIFSLSESNKWAELRIAARTFAERFPRSQMAREARSLAEAPLQPGEPTSTEAIATAP
jgi:hypothetical protein